MTARTILIHRGGFGPQHRLGTIEVQPEGEYHGINLAILGDSRRATCSCVAEAVLEVIARYTAIAECKKTPAERDASERRDPIRSRKNARRQPRKRAWR